MNGEAVTAETVAPPIAGGCFVAVVGQSGAGKDSLIAYARQRLSDDPGFCFPRRVITRDPHAVEDHDTLTEDEFATAEADGRFALAWAAHGLRYGIPALVDDHVRAGGVVVANLSRSVLAQVSRRYARPLVVEVTARPNVIAARLAARGRESDEDIAARMQRQVAIDRMRWTVHRIDNSGNLDAAGDVLLRVLKAQLRA